MRPSCWVGRWPGAKSCCLPLCCLLRVCCDLLCSVTSGYAIVEVQTQEVQTQHQPIMMDVLHPEAMERDSIWQPISLPNLAGYQPSQHQGNVILRRIIIHLPQASYIAVGHVRSTHLQCILHSCTRFGISLQHTASCTTGTRCTTSATGAQSCTLCSCLCFLDTNHRLPHTEGQLECTATSWV